MILDGNRRLAGNNSSHTSEPETPVKLDARAALVRTERKGLIARLGNVGVHVLGVDNAGKPIIYWNRLREYWLSYFVEVGAHVQSYAVLREIPRMEP